MTEETTLPKSSKQTALWRTVLVLAIPVAAQMLLQSFLGIADVLMVGSLGAEAVAAVGLASKLHFLMIVVMMGISMSCSIMVAQFSGANNFNECKRTLAMGLMLGCVFMVPFTIIFVLGRVWIPWINPDAQVVELAQTYLLITAPVLIIVQIISVFETSLRARGNTTMPLAMGALAVALNVVLNYALIFGHFGFPELGVAGAAWGTLIARIVQLLATLGWLYASRHGFALRLADFVKASDKKQMRHFLRFATPLLINHTIWAVGNTVYHVATGFAGTDALAVMGIMVPIEGTFFALFIGLTNAAAVLIGRALGANDNDLAWRLFRFFNRLILCLSVVLSIVVWFASPWILQSFSYLDENTMTLFTQAVNIFCLGVILKVNAMFRILGVLRAGGDTHYCLVVDIIVMWVFGLPIYLTAVWFGVPFVILYALTFVEEILKWTPISRRLKKGVWVKNLTVGHT